MSFAASGIAIIIFAILVGRYPNVFLAGVLSGILGLAISPMMASLNTLTHETIPEEARGRIFSSLEAVIHLAFMVFMFVAAYAAKFIDRFWIIVAVGTVFSLCGIGGIASASKGRRATCP
jgi:MFS family permease